MAEGVVLDASAVLALLQGEAGAARVVEALGAASISAVNLAEVLTVLERNGVPTDDALEAVAALGLEVIPANETAARAAAAIAASAPRRRLSLGDCFCLATARSTAMPALTADRRWASLKVGVRIEILR